MPKTMPTPCIDTVLPLVTDHRLMRFNFLSWNNMSKSISTTMPMAKLLIFFVILVRDQEVGGSNPLAPTNYFSYLTVSSPREKALRQKWGQAPPPTDLKNTIP
jgi:hypothetical protein